MVNKNHVGSSNAAGQQRSQACISRRINSMFVFHFFNVGSEFGHILVSGQKRYTRFLFVLRLCGATQMAFNILFHNVQRGIFNIEDSKNANREEQ